MSKKTAVIFFIAAFFFILCRDAYPSVRILRTPNITQGNPGRLTYVFGKLASKAEAGGPLELRARIEKTIAPLVRTYKQISQRQRKILAGEPVHEEVFLEEILPELKRRYLAYLKGKRQDSPLALLLISGGGGSAKTSVVGWFQDISGKELSGLAQQESKEAGDPMRIINFDSYILELSDRPADPVTGKSTQNPYEKFQVSRFIRDMKELTEGHVIYMPIFDFFTRGRLKIMQDKEGDVLILNGSEKAVVRIAEDFSEPSIIYAGKSSKEAKVGETPVKVFRNNEGYAVVRIHDTDHIVYRNKADSALTVRVDNNERELIKGEPVEALERLDPKGKIIIAEGILVLSDSGLNQKALSVFIDAEYWPRLLRMLVRFSKEGGRRENRLEFIEKRMTLRLTEEVPYVLPTRGYAQFLASTQTRSESILALFLAGMLKNAEKFPDDAARVFKELSIEPPILNEELRKISIEEIRRRLRMGGVVNYTPGSSFWVFFLDRELVVKTPRKEFQPKFENFVSFHENVLKRRLGGLMVPSTVCDVSDLGIARTVDGERLLLGKIIVQSKVEPLGERFGSLLKRREDISERLRILPEDSDFKEKKALFDAYNSTENEIEDLMKRYFNLQQELWKRGVVDTDPRFMEKYGLMVINGHERLVIIGIDGLTDDPNQYDPLIFSRKDIRPVDIHNDLLNYYDSLITDMIPAKDVFHDRYFGKGMREASFVPDVSDVDISEEQMRHIIELVKETKMSMLRSFFNMISAKASYPEIYWVKLYLDTVYAPGTPQYKVVENVYEYILNHAEVLGGGKNALDTMLRLVKDSSKDSALTEADQYELAEDLIYYTLSDNIEIPLNRSAAAFSL